MKQTKKQHRKSEEGAILLAALFFFALCGMGAALVLASSGSFLRTAKTGTQSEQKRFAVESAAAFLRDELSSPDTIVKIKEEAEQVTFFYVGKEEKEENEAEWIAFSENKAGGVLDSLIRDAYRTDGKRVRTKEIVLSVEMPDGNSKKELEPLKAHVKLSMNEAYQITAIVSTAEQEYKRKLVLPAQVETETIEDVTYTTIFWETGMIEKERS